MYSKSLFIYVWSLIFHLQFVKVVFFLFTLYTNIICASRQIYLLIICLILNVYIAITRIYMTTTTNDTTITARMFTVWSEATNCYGKVLGRNKEPRRNVRAAAHRATTRHRRAYTIWAFSVAYIQEYSTSFFSWIYWRVS